MPIGSVRQGTVSNEIAELAAALMARARLPLKALQDRRTELNQKSSVLTTLKTKLSTLRSELENLGAIGTLSPFASKTASSSDANILTASATSTAANSTSSITVQALAKRATHASHRYTDTATTIADAGAGTFNFTVTIGGTGYNASVTITAGDSDKTVLDNLATAINTAVGTKGSAVRLAPETGKSRLSVSSADTGTANKITFTDTDGILARVGVYNAVPTAATDTTGGYVYEDLGSNELDAKLLVDGLTYYRASNTVSDLITGVTLTLKAPSATAVTVKVAPDADKAIDKIKSFVTKYNEVLDFLKENTSVDVKAKTRGVLSLDLTYKSLAGELKAKAATVVGSQPASTPNSLASLGVRAGGDGKLSISDEAKLRETFTANPSVVTSLFNAADGVATLMKAHVENYTKSSGTIQSTQSQITLRVTGLGGQISRLETSLAKKQARLEEQLARSQALLNNLARQSAQIASYLGQGF